MVNDELAREGLARVKYIYPPNNTYEDKLKASQKKLKKKNLIYGAMTNFQLVNSQLKNQKQQKIHNQMILKQIQI